MGVKFRPPESYLKPDSGRRIFPRSRKLHGWCWTSLASRRDAGVGDRRPVVSLRSITGYRLGSLRERDPYLAEVGPQVSPGHQRLPTAQGWVFSL